MSSLISQSRTIENFHGILFDKKDFKVRSDAARNTGGARDSVGRLHYLELACHHGDISPQ